MSYSNRRRRKPQDHYFGTYPNATNPHGEPVFKAVAGTASVNGLSAALLTNNPNQNSANGTDATNPFRLDRSQAATSIRTINIRRNNWRCMAGSSISILLL